MDEKAVGFVRGFFEEAKPVGVICHGPWTLVEADVVRDRKITSWPTVRTIIRMRDELSGTEPADLAACQDTYERLRPSTAQQVLRFHRMQQNAPGTPPLSI